MRPRRDCSRRHGRGGAEPREWPASGISTSEVRQPSPGRGSRSAAGESGALRVGGAGGPVGPTSGSAAAALGELLKSFEGKSGNADGVVTLKEWTAYSGDLSASLDND